MILAIPRAPISTGEQLNGERHPETLAARRLLGAVLIDRGQLTQAEKELKSAHALGNEHLRLHTMRLSQARNLKGFGHESQVLRQLGLVVRTTESGIEYRKLRWTGRSYIAELKCSQSPASAQHTFVAVQAELDEVMPEGSSLGRDIRALQLRCKHGEAVALR